MDQPMLSHHPERNNNPPPALSLEGQVCVIYQGVDKYRTIAIRFFKLHFRQFENSKMSNKIWLRAETKPAEARSARTYKRSLIDPSMEIYEN